MLKFNKSHAEHAAIAVVIQIALWLSLGMLLGMASFTLLTTGVIACAVFLGREINQHERKEVNRLNLQYINDLPNPLVGVYKHWSIDSILDMVAPIVSCSLVAGISYLIVLV